MNRDWRIRLTGDPTRWLLDAEDNPSVYYWFQRDIVGRPEDAPALIEARDKILYSTPVQELFAAQNELGYWDNPDSLDMPHYRATLWSLALLAELGVPRSTRRAHNACEFILQNHLNADASFHLADTALAGLLVKALLYFGYQSDPRLKPAFGWLAKDAFTGEVFALYALTEIPADRRSLSIHTAIEQGAERLITALVRGSFPTIGAFPSFDPNDAVLALRVLIPSGRINDPRLDDIVETIWERQAEGARWGLESSYDGLLAAHVEQIGLPSKWATLNALRIVTQRHSQREMR